MSEIRQEDMQQCQQIRSDKEVPTMIVNVKGCKFTAGIHFSTENKENMVDKLNRLIRRDILEGSF